MKRGRTIEFYKMTSPNTLHSKSINDPIFYNITLGETGQPRDYEVNLTGDVDTDFDLLIWNITGHQVGKIASLTYPDIGFLNDTVGNYTIIVIRWEGLGSFKFVVSQIMGPQVTTTDSLQANIFTIVLFFLTVPIIVKRNSNGNNHDLVKFHIKGNKQNKL